MWLVLSLCLLAIIVGILVRVAWIDMALHEESFQWQGRLQPTTHDAFYHGSIIQRHAEDGLQGVPMVPGLLNREGLLPLVGTGLRLALPVHIDTIMLWMPVLVSSLLAIPMVLIGRALGSTCWGFGAAVLAVVAVNYFERTMAGYFDHDMISYTWAALVCWLLIEVDGRNSPSWLLPAALAIFLYPFVYASAVVVGIALAGTWIVLRIIRAPRDRFTWSSSCVLALAAMMSHLSHGGLIAYRPWAWVGALAALLIAWFLLRRGRASRWVIIAAAIAATAAMVVLVPWLDFIALFNFYLGSAVDAGGPATGPMDEIDFRRTLPGTILEAQRVPVLELGTRLLGSPIVALAGIIGYILACVRRPRLLLLLPLAAIGLLSLVGGLRFVTWGVLPASLGAAWLAMALANRVFGRADVPHVAIPIIGGIGLVFVSAWPSIEHDINLPASTVLDASNIDALVSLEESSQPGDLVLAWWDYGTGVWYYAQREVLVHPGLTNDDLFPISRILVTGDPRESASTGLALASARAGGARPVIRTLLDSVPAGNAMERYEAAITETRSPPEGDVYLYLPLEQVGKLETISSYSHPDIISGKQPNPVFSRLLDVLMTLDDWLVHLPTGLAFNTTTGETATWQPDGRITPVEFATTTIVELRPDGPTALSRVPSRETGPWAWTNPPSGFSIESTSPEPGRRVHLLVLPGAKAFIVVNDAGLQTMAIQMGVLGAFDPELYQPIYLGPRDRIYRIRSGGRR